MQDLEGKEALVGAPMSDSPTPTVLFPGKAETCWLPGHELMAPQCPDTDMVMRQTVCARVYGRGVSTAHGWGQDMRHRTRMAKATLRKDYRSLRDREQPSFVS